MERLFKYKNGTIHVMLPETCDREKLRRVTEEFLKKVTYGGVKNGYSNTTKDIRKE